MNEGPKGPDLVGAEMRRQVRQFMKLYHENNGTQGFPKSKDVDTIASILGDCLGSIKSNNISAWPKNFHFRDSFITLVARDTDGNVQRSKRAVRVPGSPLEFVEVLRNFTDTGDLPPETERDREDLARADAEAQARKDRPAAENPEPSKKPNGFREWAEREKERDKEKQRGRGESPSERMARWKREREAKKKARADENKAKTEQTKAEKERKAKEAAEAEAQKPENIIAKRIQSASSTRELKKIMSDLDAEFVRAYEKGASTLWGQRFNQMRQSDLPLRATELFDKEIGAISDISRLRKAFEDVIASGLFKDPNDPSILSDRGAMQFEHIYMHAAESFGEKIQHVKNEQELAALEKQINEFFGGSLKDVLVVQNKMKNIGIKKTLSGRESSNLTKEQTDLYEKYKKGPALTGPLTTTDRRWITDETGMRFNSTPGEKARAAFITLASVYRKKLEEFNEEF